MAKPKVVCLDCGCVGEARSLHRGPAWLGLLLLLMGGPIGVIYAIWYLATAYKGCAKCKSSRVVPIDSPRGEELLRLNPRGRRSGEGG